ncbi:MAG: HAMP domain-containing histidine kinase [Nitrospirae bacterium]|nr:HAMP domain-containing histidine kinase [Nitrospirota bacterium]
MQCRRAQDGAAWTMARSGAERDGGGPHGESDRRPRSGAERDGGGPHGESDRRPRSGAERDGGASAEEESLRSYLDGALAATTELDEMIQSMLDLAVVEEGSFEAKRVVLDAADLVKRIEKRLGPWVRQEARELAVKPPAGPIHVPADPVYLERAVKNLIMHAVRRSPVGGKVIVECETRDGSVVFSVQDQGPAVSIGSEKEYFDPGSAEEHRELGWKADRAFALACVKKVADGHGGSVGIQSGIEGTSFFLRLPAEGGPNGNASK